MIYSDKNQRFIELAVNKSAERLGVEADDILWHICGSFVTNTQTKNSDLDLMAVGDCFSKPERIVFSFNNVPIHLTSVSWKDLEMDGKNYTFGSYFSGRLIIPHITIAKNLYFINRLNKIAGEFIGPMAGFVSSFSKMKFFTGDDLARHVTIAYFSTFPNYLASFMGYMNSPDFLKIWKIYAKQVEDMLIEANIISRTHGGYKYANGHIKSFNDFHWHRMVVCARQWSYATSVRDEGYRFYDSVIDIARRKISKYDANGKKYRLMSNFIRKRTNLKDIIV